MTPKGVRTSAAFLLLAALLLLPSGASAQPATTGSWFRPDCTTLTNPTTFGVAACWDTTANYLKGWDGTRWTAASATTVNNVRDFGAKCDGATDDQSAISSAITAAVSVPNGAVYIPASPNGCKIASGLTVTGALTIFGASSMASKIMFTGTGSAFTFSSAASGTNLHDFQVSNFPAGVENTNAVWAFIINNTSRLSMDRMRIQWSGTGGSIQCTNLTHSLRIAHSYLSDIKAIGISGVSGQACNMLTVTDNTIEGSSTAAGTLISTSGLGAKISGNTLETGLIGIDIVSGGGIDISGNYFEALATSAIRATVSAQTDGLTIQGNNIIQGSATGVDLSATALLTAVVMNGNRLKGATGTPLKLGGGFVTSSAIGPDFTDAANYFTGTPALSVLYDSTKNTSTFYDVNGVARMAFTLTGATAVTNAGVVVGAPTGTDKGAGTVNASSYYVHGTAIASMPLTNASGTTTNAPHLVQDTVTLTGGTAGVALAGAAAFTSATTYTCVCDNDSAVLACRVVQNGGNGFTVSSGAGTDVVRFICAGN